MSADVDDVSRSAELAMAMGFEVIPLVRPIRGTWSVLALGHNALLLIAVVREAPDPFDRQLALPAGFPAWVTRIVHVWGKGQRPETIPL